MNPPSPGALVVFFERKREVQEVLAHPVPALAAAFEQESRRRIGLRREIDPQEQLAVDNRRGDAELSAAEDRRRFGFVEEETIREQRVR